MTELNFSHNYVISIGLIQNESTYFILDTESHAKCYVINWIEGKFKCFRRQKHENEGQLEDIEAQIRETI
jgi:hypothetical protein